jgi:HEAT repeat protein
VSLSEHDPQILRALVEALERAAEPRRRRNAARALGHLGALARPVVHDLAMAAVEDRDDGVRGESAHAIRRLGPVAASAIPYLSAALLDPSPSVRSEAASTLNAIWNAMIGSGEERCGGH